MVEHSAYGSSAFDVCTALPSLRFLQLYGVSQLPDYLSRLTGLQKLVRRAAWGCCLKGRLLPKEGTILAAELAALQQVRPALQVVQDASLFERGFVFRWQDAFWEECYTMSR